MTYFCELEFNRQRLRFFRNVMMSKIHIKITSQSRRGKKQAGFLKLGDRLEGIIEVNLFVWPLRL